MQHFDYRSVAGDYQYQALLHGFPMQRFWHKGKLIFWDEVIAPQLAGPSGEGPIAEVGCGAGLLLQHLAEWAQLKMGVDINFQALTFLSSRFQQLEQYSPFLPLLANGEILPLMDGSLDGLILSEVLEHLPQPQHLLSEAFRVVRPGGWCYLTTPNYHSLWPWMEKTLDLFRLTPPIVDAQHVFHLNMPLLQTLVQDWQIQTLTTFYSLSPFLAVFSDQAALRSLLRESHANSRNGMLIACLLRKPS
jgi:SAM-dependent methyltransferase